MFFRFSSRRIIGCFIGVNIFLLTSFMFVSWYNSPPDFVFKHPYFLFDIDIEEPRSLDQKCVLPRLHPFHPSIWLYLKLQKNISCKHKQAEFTYIDTRGYLLYNYTEVLNAGYEVGSSLFCDWSSVLRTPDDGDEKVSFASKVQLPTGGSKLSFEVVRVQCKNYAGFLVYEKILAHIPVAKTRNSSSPKHPINVLIFGLDSLSRLAFIRHLPRTYHFLTKELNMTVLRGMNKVGDNTFPNLIPLLTGRKAYGDGLGGATGYFDGWPLIWKNFSDAGFGTLWAEDFIQFGLFNYLAKGFIDPPTDYYMRPYWLALESSNLMKHSSFMCYGSVPKYFVQLDYLKRFIEKYEGANKPYFAFSFLAELTHDYTTRIASADTHFESFFTSLKADGYLNNTVMIVMSDHGHRFDSIRTTQVGRIEELLPFFSIYIPHHISSLHPKVKKSLQLNSGRLVTPFDTHATLMDLLHLAVDDRLLGQADSTPEGRGQTLFREVSANRTCQDASIPVEYCSCQIDTAISSFDPRVQVAAETTVWSLNEMIKASTMEHLCAKRTLQSIKSAHLVHITEKRDVPGDNIRVIIETEPNGVFEALISVQKGAASVLGEVSRINSYRSQSDCIEHVILRKFCYCIRNVDEKLPKVSSN